MWSLFSRDPTSSFAYEIGEAVEHTRSVWKIHRGKKKQNGDEVSVFICEGRDGTTAQLDIAKAAVKRLKTLRHPCILTYIDSLENEKLVYLVTEPVTPLLTWLKDSALSPSHRTNAVSWGLLQVTKGLSFLNNDGKLIHYNVCGSSVFVTPGGEWKLGGVEYASSDSSMFPVKVLPELEVYNPPEKVNPSKMRTTTMWAADMWGLGCLIWEVFNGHLDESFSLKNTQKLPKNLIETYAKLVGTNPGARPNPRDVVEDLRKPGQFFRNDLIETLLFLEEIQLKDANEKHKFFANLTPKLENIPNYIATNKILPTVISAHEFSNVGSVVLSPLFKIGKLLDEAEYQRQILPTVVKLFSSSDRATRLKLLQQMESLVEYMDPKTVNDQVFPQLATGFSDSNPTIREQTVKSIMFLAPKLNYHNLNIEVLKHFARLQLKDEQGGIRTNTTVCLGKVAQYLHPDIRQKCLTSAFTRAMRDPFPPARIAGIMAIAATQQYYPLQEVVTKILPSLCHLTLDPEKSVRDAVFRVLKGFLSKVEKVSEDPSLKEVMEAEVKSAAATSQTTWTGWAVGAITSKFYKTSSGGAQPQKQTSTSSSGTVTPSTKTSSLASTPSQGRASSNTPTSAAPNEDDKSDYEDWENSEWQSMDDGLDTKPIQSRTALPKSTTVSEALADVGDMDGGDGWGDDTEEWGSLEDTQHGDSLGGGELEPESKFRSTASYNWESSGPAEDTDDFFSSLVSGNEGKSGSVSQRMTNMSLQSPTSGGWDDWDAKSPAESSNTGGNSKSDEQRRLREEKRLQRQKEIEAKRAARMGPMKLGAKKM
ncbi:N-terminal kinase-like protein [Penaeus vannamei]|uniref:N-terminal kinase-like protein n=1 Tax=Penaeus vannamei TaxID=6689 RepID=A0A423TJD9_PENVA|nr:N-terminal kinase-like protein isoform X1 [Penaeus vannamei]ROT76596.1 N-terminal kinase-like protein [Penaeus vannamei]